MAGKHEIESSEGRRRQLQGLPVIRRNVAGIDLGSEQHWVCAPTAEGSAREIASFGATTAELIRIAEWLKARQVESVAMESTGVYWITVFPEVGTAERFALKPMKNERVYLRAADFHDVASKRIPVGRARAVAGSDGIERKDAGQVGSETYPQRVGVRRQKWVANGAISAVLLRNLGRWRQTG